MANFRVMRQKDNEPRNTINHLFLLLNILMIIVCSTVRGNCQPSPAQSQDQTPNSVIAQSQKAAAGSSTPAKNTEWPLKAGATT